MKTSTEHMFVTTSLPTTCPNAVAQLDWQEQALQVARVTKIIDPGTDDTKPLG